ncbi:hypothetical protein [Candidatus Nitrosotenuis uzonensis]|uniref:hypothetical protein n=1 Tax=Candidatus Nitrosotenuis uzonensis TaxID=1407055 RepID=UPI0019622728|nr:hypothetical protein [Candidatus Nitrosotenuis uzonensis]
MTKKRITFTIDEELHRKVRNMQVRLISSTQKGWSYSSVLSILIKEGLESNAAQKLVSKKSN